MRPLLLTPFLKTTRNSFFPKGMIPWKSIGICAFSLIICALLYMTTLKVVSYFHKQNELGIILSIKIFQMAWITLSAMLVFSCMVSAVSAIFLSQDNEIVFAAPVTPAKLFFMRFTTTFFYTSWMMIIFSIPVFGAFGLIFNSGPLYFPFMLTSLLCTAATSVAFGTGLTILLVNFFPAKRTKDIVFYLSLCFALFIFLMFRLIRPEDLANPDQFGHFIDYLSNISGPSGPYVPGGWAADFMIRYLLDREIDWLLFGLIIITPFSLFFIGEWLMSKLFFNGFSKAQESFGGYKRFSADRKTQITSPFRWMMKKDAITFIRDSAEWSQLFMIGTLIVIYLYNFKVLPLDRSFWKEEYLTNLIAFLNIGLAGFIITSLSTRFVFPSIGAEGGAFFIIRSSPLSLKSFFWQKYIFYTVPFSFLTVVLIALSGYLLKLDGPIWWISLGTTLFLTWIIVAIALGFGALYANFKAENRAAAIGSIGAILLLLTCLAIEGAILITGAWPTYKITKKWLHQVPLAAYDFVWLSLWAFLSIAICTTIALIILRRGKLKLEDNSN